MMNQDIWKKQAVKEIKTMKEIRRKKKNRNCVNLVKIRQKEREMNGSNIRWLNKTRLNGKSN